MSQDSLNSSSGSLSSGAGSGIIYDPQETGTGFVLLSCYASIFLVDIECE